MEEKGKGNVSLNHTHTVVRTAQTYGGYEQQRRAYEIACEPMVTETYIECIRDI